MVRCRALPGLAAIVAFVLAVLAACTSTPGREPPPQVPGGDPGRGAQLIEQLGCGSCHVVPGVRGADGLVGPPLIHWSRRGFIAGELPNNATNLIRWLMDPQSVEPGTDMPNLHLSQAQARDVAAYLFGLE